MLDIGFSELLLLGAVALIVLGPEKLPIAARTAGRWYAHLRRMISTVQRDIEQELQLADMRDQMQRELARIKDMEQSMQQQLNQMNENLAELNPAYKSTSNDGTTHQTTVNQLSEYIYELATPATTALQQQPWHPSQRNMLIAQSPKTSLMHSSEHVEPIPETLAS